MPVLSTIIPNSCMFLLLLNGFQIVVDTLSHYSIYRLIFLDLFLQLNRRSEIVANSSGEFILKTYVRRNKSESFKTLKGNPIGLNMLSNSKKLRYRHFTTHPLEKIKEEFDTKNFEANRPNLYLFF